jgi:hypothetical protein
MHRDADQLRTRHHVDRLCASAARAVGCVEQKVTPAEFRQKKVAYLINSNVRVR